MSTEIVFNDEAEAETPPPMVMEADEKNGKAEKAERLARVRNKDRVPEKPPEKLDDHTGNAKGYKSAPLSEMRKTEDMNIKDIIEGLGPDGSFRISIKRMSPEEFRDPATGKMVTTGGHLATVEEAIDEDWLMKKYGGDKYELIFKRKNEIGRYVYAGSKTLKIAGDPVLSELPRSSLPPGVAGPGTAESPTVVNKALDMMSSMVEKAEQRADRAQDPRGGSDPATDRMLNMMQAQLDASQRQMAELRREAAIEREKSVPAPVVDTFKDRLLDKMLDGDNARIVTVRTQLESEIRMVKDHAREDEKRLRDGFDRERSDLRASHERELSMIRAMHESNMTAMKSSNEISLAAAKNSYDTNVKLSEAENRRLERDNADLRVEVKELRAKKDKTFLEQAKDLEQLKDALGVGDEADKSGLDKLLEAGPALAEGVMSMINKRKDAAAPVEQAQQQQMQRRRPEMFEGPNGQKFVMRQGRLVPARLRKEVQAAVAQQPVVAADGTVVEGSAEVVAPVEPEFPEIDAEALSQLTTFLESAFGGGQDPEVVAQGLRPRMPGPVLIYLRDRVDTLGMAQGVDVFLSKVAKLPGTSPLATQSGRNWIRKVGAALVGGADD